MSVGLTLLSSLPCSLFSVPCSLFAVMIQEREPLRSADLPALFTAWVQDVGGFAAVGLVLGALVLLRQRSFPWEAKDRPLWFKALFLLGCVGTLGGYLLAAVFSWLVPDAAAPCLLVGGLCAIFAILLPFLRGLVRLRPRRIGGLAMLSIKEGRDRWALWILAPYVAVFLFAGWFLPHNPESELRTSVQLVFGVMTRLLLITAVLLASFSIPNDIGAHTIATVVTKPVERFEIALGRFLGYVVLMSGILLVMVAAGLLFIARQEVPTEAEFESLRARVPIYGDLHFQGKEANFQGMISGREWMYRKYIAGHPQSSHRAVWSFREIPGRLKERASVPCEFRFDIYRLHRAEKEGQGVLCSLTFLSRFWDPKRKSEYDKQMRIARQQAGNPDTYAAALNSLAGEFGIFEVPFKEVTDAHTYVIDVPVGLFRHASGRGPSVPAAEGPLLNVSVKCESASQLVGMAKPDLYFVDGEGYFALNFLKGALGLWFRICLVIGLAVAVSTYLSGVITLVTTLFLYLAGFFTDYIQNVAFGRNAEGGPLEALRQIVTGQTAAAAALDPAARVSDVFDEAFRWYLRRILSVVPDVNLFSLTDYVANGFDIAAGELALRALVLAGYLLPWAVAAYYLLKAREVAA